MEAFGINVPVLVSLTFGFGVALAAFAGVLAAPIMQVSALTGQTMIVIVFAVVVIGGMGSIAGTVVTGIGLGLQRRLGKVAFVGLDLTATTGVLLKVLGEVGSKGVREEGSKGVRE